MPEPLPYRLAASVGVTLASVGQPGRPFRPRAYWERVQLRRIRRMVRHARGSVPFYRQVLEARALTAGDFRSPADLLRLPLIGRDDYAARPDAFQSRVLDRNARVALRTTGSSGCPAEFWHDRRSMILNIAYGRRETAVQRGAVGRYSNPITIVFRHPGSEFNAVRRYYEDTLYIPSGRRRSRTVSTDRPMEQNIALLRRLRPRVVSAHGSYLGEILLRPGTLEPGGWRPAVAVYAADPPTESAARRLRDLGIRVQSLYRAGEALKIGFSCEVGEGLHIHPDLVHLAIVDDEGVPVAPGETGDIVLSNLLNRATVLLNYRIGDRGSLSEEPCPCGRSFPLLKGLDGRSSDLVRLRSGLTLETADLTRVFRDRDDVIRFQVVQTDMSFEVRVRAAPGAEPDGLRREVARAYRRLLGPDADIRVTLTDRRLMNGDTKWRPVIVRTTPSQDHGL